MTRMLTFDGARAATRFQLLWTALIGGDGKSDRSPATIRKEARLLTVFDAISEPSPNGNEPDRQLKPGDAAVQVRLAQEDFDLLQSYTEKTQWNPRVSREVVDLWDWLSTAEKHES